MALRKSILVQLFWNIHPRLYRWSGGRVGGHMMNMPVLLLTTHGRRSGQARTRALMYLPVNDTFVVIASFLGEPRHPDWWLNLKANAHAEVQIGNRTVAVVAREAQGEERTALWDKVVARQPDYAEYQKRTKRNIPVVVLEPR
jgi:deazaflavin-dependent oxidoreductase (nitroreductase family)